MSVNEHKKESWTTLMLITRAMRKKEATRTWMVSPVRLKKVPAAALIGGGRKKTLLKKEHHFMNL